MSNNKNQERSVKAKRYTTNERERFHEVGHTASVLRAVFEEHVSKAIPHRNAEMRRLLNAADDALSAVYQEALRRSITGAPGRDQSKTRSRKR